MSAFTHHGPWSARSRSNPALHFIEKYLSTIDSFPQTSSSPPPSSTFFSPFATYHDTKGSVHLTGSQIWTYLLTQLSPFSSIRHEIVEFRSLIDEDGRDIVYGETIGHFRLRSEGEGGEEISCPRFFVWTLGMPGQEGEGWGERVCYDCRVFWDTGVLGRYVTERKREERRREEKEVGRRVEVKRVKRA
ncbi:hypothetical protein B0J14DRAFT_128159 [Halenospora varia]|nr:hypothetical protein B0J14DRAFT_128159 [Halenospora varia]